MKINVAKRLLKFAHSNFAEPNNVIITKKLGSIVIIRENDSG